MRYSLNSRDKEYASIVILNLTEYKLCYYDMFSVKGKSAVNYFIGSSLGRYSGLISTMSDKTYGRSKI